MKQLAAAALVVFRILWPFAVRSNPERAGTIVTVLAVVAWLVALTLGGVAPDVPVDLPAPAPIEASADTGDALPALNVSDPGAADVGSPPDVAPLDAGAEQ